MKSKLLLAVLMAGTELDCPPDIEAAPKRDAEGLVPKALVLEQRVLISKAAAFGKGDASDRLCATLSSTSKTAGSVGMRCKSRRMIS